MLHAGRGTSCMYFEVFILPAVLGKYLFFWGVLMLTFLSLVTIPSLEENGQP